MEEVFPPRESESAFASASFWVKGIEDICVYINELCKRKVWFIIFDFKNDQDNRVIGEVSSEHHKGQRLLGLLSNSRFLWPFGIDFSLILLGGLPSIQSRCASSSSRERTIWFDNPHLGG